MTKAFLFAATTALILAVLFLYFQNFSVKQTADIGRMAQVLVSEKVAHTWSDIRDDIYRATNLRVSQQNNSITLNDLLPSAQNVSNLLNLYGLFIDTKYLTPDLSVKFLSPSGQPMNLSDISSTLMILPFNIQYGYDDWWKKDAFITTLDKTGGNLSAIIMIYMTINLTDSYLYCTPANPSGPAPCYTGEIKLCGQKDKLYLNLSFSDYLGHYFNLPDNCFDRTYPGVEKLHYKNASAEQDLFVDIGKLTGAGTGSGVSIQAGYPVINLTTTLILNTTDFYTNYLSQLQVSAVNYNTSRTDWS
jgi:hypothetical protein